MANNKIRKIDNDIVSTLAGSGTNATTDGNGALAAFADPYGIAIDGDGNIYVTQALSGGYPSSNPGFSINNGNNNYIRKITPAGEVTIFAGSGVRGESDNVNKLLATYGAPVHLLFDSSKNSLYVSEWFNDKIRKMDLVGFAVVPDLPSGLTLNPSGNITGTPNVVNNGPVNYTITAYNNYGISAATISINTGNAPGVNTSLVSAVTASSASTGGSFSSAGSGELLERGICWGTAPNPTILDNKVINATTGIGAYTSTISGLTFSTTYYVRAYATNVFGTAYGTQRSFTTALGAPAISYNSPNDFILNTAIAPLQIINTGGAIPSVLTKSPVVSTIAGSSSQGSANGIGTLASFKYPAAVAVTSGGQYVYVADTGNHLIRRINKNGGVETFAGSGVAGATDGTGAGATFNAPFGVAVDAAGNVYVTDYNNRRIRKITPAGLVTTLAGSDNYGLTDGQGTDASFNSPRGITIDGAGNLYVTDLHQIRKITPSGLVSTLAGNQEPGATDGVGAAASFQFPQAVAVDAEGTVYVSDSHNRKIRKITPTGTVSTFAGSGNQGSGNGVGIQASFWDPRGIAVDAAGNVYVAEQGLNIIRKITTTGIVTTFAGSGSGGLNDGDLTTAGINYPFGLATDAIGDVYLTEYYGNRIRKIALAGYSVSPALPQGLVLNMDGSITGTPTISSPAVDYVIKGANYAGSSSTTVRIGVAEAILAIATWTGTEWINGPISPTAPAIIEGDYTPSSSFEVGELTIKNNAVVTIPSGFNITINGKLTVETGSSFTLENNANLIQTTEVLNSGVIAVKRNTAALKLMDHVLWSSPVKDQQLQSFSPATLSNHFYTYEGTTNFYTAVNSPNTTDFEQGTGYLIRMPNDHPTTPTIWTGTFTGVPKNGSLTVTVNNGAYTALGNPYPSTIDADAFIDGNYITEALYFWRKTNNTANTSYATYTKAGGVGTANSADLNGLIPNGTIQVGQGFIASVNYIDAIFTNAMRTTNNDNQFLKTKNTDKNRIWLNLTNDSGFFSQAMVAYMDNATSGVDATIDGRYFNDSKTALTSIINNEEFTIQGRSLPFDANDIVALGFKTETAGDFTLAIDKTDGLFAAGQKVYLKDNANNTINDISSGSYVFASAAGVFNSRFELVYQKTLGTTDADLLANHVMVSNQNDKISIDAGVVTIAEVKVYDVNGRLIVERKNINAPTAVLTISGPSQMLLVQVSTSDGSVILKKILKHQN